MKNNFLPDVGLVVVVWTVVSAGHRKCLEYFLIQIEYVIKICLLTPHSLVPESYYAYQQ